MAKISEEKLNEFKETFMLFDKDGDGLIHTKDMGAIVKYLNQDFTDDEVMQMVTEADPDNSQAFDFATFVVLITKWMKDDDALEELLEVFDPENSGVIATTEFRYILLQMGEKMTPQEAKDIIKEVDPDDSGFVKYEDYARRKYEEVMAAKSKLASKKKKKG